MENIIKLVQGNDEYYYDARSIYKMMIVGAQEVPNKGPIKDLSKLAKKDLIVFTSMTSNVDAIRISDITAVKKFINNWSTKANEGK